MTIRPAAHQDVDALLALAERQRREYATYQPVFWRPAADAVARQRSYFAGQLGGANVIARVAVVDCDVVAFAVGRLTAAPPVYDPGGLSCVVDDFAVAERDMWPTVGVDLIHAMRDAARQRGAVQLVVVTAHLDAAKRAALAAVDLGIASEWWTGRIDTD